MRTVVRAITGALRAGAAVLDALASGLKNMASDLEKRFG